MKHTNQADYTTAFYILNRLESIFNKYHTVDHSTPKNQDLERLEALTYNNLGCIYIRLGKYYYALTYLKKAYRILKPSIECTDAAIVLLNICVLYSKTGEHVKAEDSAKKAIESVLACLKECKQDAQNSLFVTNINDADYQPDKCIEIVNMLYMAYYKFGVESVHVGNVERAVKLIERAKEIYKFIAQFCENNDTNFDKLCIEALDKLHKRRKMIAKDERSKNIYKSYIIREKKQSHCTLRNGPLPVVKHPAGSKKKLRRWIVPERLRVYTDPYPKKIGFFPSVRRSAVIVEDKGSISSSENEYKNRKKRTISIKKEANIKHL